MTNQSIVEESRSVAAWKWGWGEVGQEGMRKGKGCKGS